MRPLAWGILVVVGMPSVWWLSGQVTRFFGMHHLPHYEVHHLLYRFNRGFSWWVATNNFEELTEKVYSALGEDWSNRVPLENLQAAKSIVPVHATYVCGLNCVNACLQMWGFELQVAESNYPHNSIYVPLMGAQRWGAHGQQYESFVKQCFEACKCQIGQPFPLETHKTFWQLLDTTDFTTCSVVALTHNGLVMHYVIILGRRSDGKEFLVTNAVPKAVWVIGREKLETICKCTMPLVEAYAFYAVGVRTNDAST